MKPPTGMDGGCKPPLDLAAQRSADQDTDWIKIDLPIHPLDDPKEAFDYASFPSIRFTPISPDGAMFVPVLVLEALALLALT